MLYSGMENNMKNEMKINKELTLNKATHVFNGVRVKVFMSTVRMYDDGMSGTGEILEGINKGKWTTVNMVEAVELC